MNNYKKDPLDKRKGEKLYMMLGRLAKSTMKANKLKVPELIYI